MKKLAFLGDSLTHAGRWDEFFPAYEVSNHGVPGEKSNEILQRLPGVLSENPDVLFVMMGINDLGDGIDEASIIENYSKLIAQVISKIDIKMVVQSVLPVNFQLFPTKEFNSEKIRLINKLLINLCKEENITFVDLYASLSTYSNELMKEYTYDGLHLNEAGYRIWHNCLQSEKLI
ncbi:GDSL-type esterase/lipase family protein [Marinifilum caeruleilacunae]|uniref:SGNH hydrolase-type esterase domain-containing protein n=1 Tax=Marinifilum caeruleilacunae TaxID=2499076 RepID=A0ABX1X095_9BACT|nr:GDSL-type esterase/lipase family protein [Marinifilum caeruleilacunae]NOU61826.1 hypothetical protein [Marinifilum caeruleilacunae]